MSLEPGATLGRYRILGQLGQGGMATVYRAHQASLDREIALKVLRPAFAEDTEFLQRFEREARAIARLRHPNIVQVFDFEEQGGAYVLAMELLEGGTLKDRMVAERAISPRDAVRIIEEVAAALSYAHRNGVVHRDVKPSNVMLTEDGRAVVTDFGIARMLEQTSHTQTGVGIGTPEYMSPEQGQGKKVDHRADIYSLGVMAYEILTGRLPYTADTPLAVVIAHIREPLPLPSAVNPAIGPRTERVLLKALAKNPDDRFASANELAAALAESLAAEPLPATAPTAVRGATVVPPSFPVLPAAIVAGVIVIAAVAGYAVARGPGGATTARPAATARYAEPAKGAPLWSAALDGSAEFLVTSATGGKAALRPARGATTFAITEASITGESQVSGAPAVALPDSYVAELDFAFTQGSSIGATWTLRSDGDSPRLTLTMDTPTQQIRLERRGASPLQYEYVPIADLASGKMFTLTVSAAPPRYAVYLDGKPLLRADNETASGTNSLVLAARQWLGGTGDFVVSGLRVFAGVEAATYVATPEPARTPAPTIPPRPAATPHVPPHAVPPKGALVYDAQIVEAELVHSGCPGKAQNTTLTFSNHTAVMSLVAPNDAVCWRLNPGGASIPEAYIVEADFAFAPASDASLQIFPRQGQTAGSSFIFRSTGSVEAPGLTSDRRNPQIPELAAAKSVAVAIVSRANKVTLFVNEADLGTYDEAISGLTSLVELRFRGNSGSVTINGLRVYALP